MPNVAKATVRWFKFKTWLGFTLIVAFGTVLGVGIGGIFAVAFGLDWVKSRNTKLRLLEAEYGEGLGHEIAKVVNDFVQDYREIKDYFASFQFRNGVPCKTCGCLLSEFEVTTVGLCWELRDVFPHNPNDEPPDPNPWAWFWFHYHGYEPPPADWPNDELYIPPYASNTDFARLAKQLGRKYFLNHNNPVWDRGMSGGNGIPDWYVCRVVEQSGKQPDWPQRRTMQPRRTTEVSLTASNFDARELGASSSIEGVLSATANRLLHYASLATCEIGLLCRNMKKTAVLEPSITNDVAYIEEQLRRTVDCENWQQINPYGVKSSLGAVFLSKLNAIVSRVNSREHFGISLTDALKKQREREPDYELRIPVIDSDERAVANEEILQSHKQAEEASAKFLRNAVESARTNIEFLREYHFKRSVGNPTLLKELECIDGVVSKEIELGRWGAVSSISALSFSGLAYTFEMNEETQRIRNREDITGMPVSEALEL